MTDHGRAAAAAGERRPTPPVAPRRRVGLVGIAACGLLAATLLAACRSEPDDEPRIVVVDAVAPPGGDGSAAAPWSTLQPALEQGGPGVEIHVRPGTYRGPFRTVRGGTTWEPMRLLGTDATLIAGDDEELLTVGHDHVEISGFTLREADRLLVVDGVREVVVTGNELRDAGGECVQLRSVRHVRIEDNTIEGCGRLGFDLAASRTRGAGVSVGMPPEQTDRVLDASHDIVVRGNDISTPAACVAVEVGARGVVIEANTCRGGRDPGGAGISVRGHGNVVRANAITDQDGAGVLFGGDGPRAGIDNEVVDNEITGVDGYGISGVGLPQRLVCGNRVEGAGRGTTDDAQIDPTMACER